MILCRNWDIKIFCSDGLIIISRKMEEIGKLKILVMIWLMVMHTEMCFRMLLLLCLKIIMIWRKKKELSQSSKPVKKKVCILLLVLMALFLEIQDSILFFVHKYSTINMAWLLKRRSRFLIYLLNLKQTKQDKSEFLRTGSILKV